MSRVPVLPDYPIGGFVTCGYSKPQRGFIWRLCWWCLGCTAVLGIAKLMSLGLVPTSPRQIIPFLRGGVCTLMPCATPPTPAVSPVDSTHRLGDGALPPVEVNGVY